MGVYKLQAREPEMFEFEYKGKVHRVPAINSLRFSTFMRIREALQGSDSPEEVGFDEIMGIFNAYVPDVMAEMLMDEAKELFVAYSSQGNNMGES